MKQIFILLTLLMLLRVHAEPPTKRSMVELKGLWEKSPFTIKAELTPGKSELEEWSLAGVSTNPQGGYTVTIVNKKDRTDRRRVHSTGKYSESDVEGFKILEVSQSGLNYKETKVKLSVSGNEGWVTYDEKLLAIKPATPVLNVQARGAQKKIVPGNNARNNQQNQQQKNQQQNTANQQQQQAAPQRGAPLPSSRRPRIRRAQK